MEARGKPTASLGGGGGSGCCINGRRSFHLAADSEAAGFSELVLSSPFCGGTSLCIPGTLEHRGMLPTLHTLAEERMGRWVPRGRSRAQGGTCEPALSIT